MTLADDAALPRSYPDPAGPSSSRLADLVFLGLTLLLATPVAAPVPVPGLDASWQAALNRTGDLRFGSEISYTYGPWGFLNYPSATNPLNCLMAGVFTAVVLGALWVLLRRAAERAVSSPTAARLIAMILVTILATCEVSELVVALFIAATVLVVELDVSGASRRIRLVVPLGLGALAALMVQVKFSDGVACVAIGLLASVLATRGWARLSWAVLYLASAAAASVLWWLLRGQDVGEIPTWLERSWWLASGYSEAMSLASGRAEGYVLAAAVAVALLVAVAGRSSASRWPLLLLGAMVVGYAFKAGFTRQDEHHEPTYFGLVALLAVLLVPVVGRRVLALATGVVAMLLFQLQGPGTVAGRPLEQWLGSAQMVLDPGYREVKLDEARQAAKAAYAVPDDVLGELEGHGVSVDPWETNLVWAYGLGWAPVPVFQTFSAYGPLDEVNAEAVADVEDRRVLRPIQPPAIDGRNALWESPHYQLALACHYRTVLRSPTWQVLAGDDDRCREPELLSTTTVDAGEEITLPPTADDELLVVDFVPEPANPVSRLVTKLFKDFSPPHVVADGAPFRLASVPSGPLMVRFPEVPDGAFAAFSYSTLSFDSAGAVEIRSVPLAG